MPKDVFTLRVVGGPEVLEDFDRGGERVAPVAERFRRWREFDLYTV